MIDNDDIEKVKNMANIVDVVGDFVTLRRRGANYMGLCPFHNERTPSFSVSPAKGFCYCFSCHEGGDPVSFLMKIQNMTFIEAIRYLAQKYGVELHETEQNDQQLQEARQRESILNTNQFALQFFEHQLRDTQEGTEQGKSLLYGLKLSDVTIATYRLGYAPTDDTALPTYAQSQGFAKHLLTNAGICHYADGDTHTLHQAAVIIPVMSNSGKILAFSSLSPQQIKMPQENPVYKPATQLFGLFQAKISISKEKKAFITPDCVSAMLFSQIGGQNVVATNGAAISATQLDLLKRLTPQVTIVSSKANDHLQKAFNMARQALKAGFNVRLLTTPADTSLAAYLQTLSASTFQQLLSEEADFITYITAHTNTTAGAQQALKQAALAIAMIPDEIKRSVYTSSVAASLNITEDEVNSLVESFIRLSGF